MATVPGAPTLTYLIETQPGQLSVYFTAPANNGGSAITSYTASTSVGGFTVSGTSSPLVLNGLATGGNNSVTVTVTATNAIGTSVASNARTISLGCVLAWTKQNSSFNTISNETSTSIAVDTSQNIYLAFHTSGSTSGNTNLGSTDIVLTKFDQNGTLLWLKQDAQINTTLADVAPSIAIDSQKNIYLTYHSFGSVSGQTNMGNGDIVVVKYNTDGVYQWAKQNNSFNTTYADYVPSIKIDSSDNIYITYYTAGTISDKTSTGGNDIAIIKLDTNGNIIWVIQNNLFNTIANDGNPSIDIDTTGNVYVTYQTNGTVSGGTTTGLYDTAVVKFNQSGVHQWTKQLATFNTTADDTYPKIAVDSTGNLYVTYYTTGTVSGGTVVGSNDIVLYKLNSSGNLVWIKQTAGFNSGGSDANPQINIDKYDNIYLVYTTTSSITNSDGILVNANDLRIVKFDTNGNILLRRQNNLFNGSGNDYISTNERAIVTDLNGNIYISYTTTGTISGNTTSGSSDVVLAKFLIMDQYAPTITNVSGGNSQATISFNPPSVDNGYSITSYTVTSSPEGKTATGNSSPIIVTGLTNGTYYSFTLSATNSVGTIYNSPSSSTIMALTVPDAPTSVSASAGNGQATVSFTAPASNGGSAITSYRVISSPGGFYADGSSSPITVTGLANGTAYTFTVTATNVAGTGSASSASSAVTPVSPSAGAAVSDGSAAIVSYISSQPASSPAEKTSLIVNMRSGLKDASYANNTEKAAAKKAYIDAMKEKFGTSIQTISSANFDSFISTMTTKASGLTAKDVTLVYPTFNVSNVGEVDLTNLSTSSYLFFEAPIGYSIVVKNGASSLTMTFTGTSYTTGGTTYNVGDNVTVGDKSFQLIGVGSGGFQLNNNNNNNQGPICFLGNAPVLTPTGYRRIDSLAVGDLVRTADGRDVAIQRVKHQRIVTPSAEVNPFVIPKGTWGATENVAISPRHCVAVPGRGMVEARDLGLRQMSLKAAFDYYNLELPEWDNMVVAGVEVESMAPTKKVVLTAAQFKALLSSKGSVDMAKLARIARVREDGLVDLILTRKARRTA